MATVLTSGSMARMVSSIPTTAYGEPPAAQRIRHDDGAAASNNMTQRRSTEHTGLEQQTVLHLLN